MTVLVTNVIQFMKNFASAGNRTRAARVAGEHSTTEPPMLLLNLLIQKITSGKHDTRLSLLQPDSTTRPLSVTFLS